MKDHTMCVKASCAARKSCARYTADPERGQALYHPDPKLNKHGSCEKFIASDELKGAVLNKREAFLAHTHKYHTIQHREDSIARGKLPLPIVVDGVKIPTEKQVEFFERKLKVARFKEYGRQLYNASNILTVKGVDRGHCTRMASDHTVDLHTGEAVRGHIHIVVMTDSDPAALKALSDEMNEVMRAKY